MDIKEQSIKLHYQWKGKLEIVPKMSLNSAHDLSLAYTPGVAAPCLEIKKDKNKSYELTGRCNTVAVVTDGTAVLGLGDIGPEAAMPVMEGKCVLFKSFGGVDAVPLCLATKDTDEIVKTIALLAPSFGGINLEDISAPRCFEIEQKLKAICDIPIFHDDQHGTAVVTLAALSNALKIVDKDIKKIKLVVSGAGAAGTAIVRLLMARGLKNVIMCDTKGVISKSRIDLDSNKHEIAQITNPDNITGTLADAVTGADVFIGVSGPGILTPEMVKRMAKDSITFAMANPEPEILPETALSMGAAVVGTGRSDYPNQINNVLAFPGIFRGALDVRASDINDKMKLAAADAISSFITNPSPERILPAPFEQEVHKTVAKAVADAARASGVARV